MNHFYKIFFALIILIIASGYVFAETVKLEGEIQKEQKVIQSAVSRDIYKGLDIQVLKTSLYYYPEAEMNYYLLKQKAEIQNSHLFGYREIDGLYMKALTESTVLEKLEEWNTQGGPSPYYIKAGAELRNNGTAAVTDINLRFVFDVKVAPLSASASSLTTDYRALERDAAWRNWMTKDVKLEILPPGEYTMVYTEDLSLCPLLQKLNNRWPLYLRVKVTSSSPGDPRKENNFASSEIKLIPDHFIMRAIH